MKMKYIANVKTVLLFYIHCPARNLLSISSLGDLIFKTDCVHKCVNLAVANLVELTDTSVLGELWFLLAMPETIFVTKFSVD